MNLEELINKARAGDNRAREQLIKKMFNDGYLKQLNKYLHLNRLLKPEDVRSEFWLGVLKAMSKVKFRIAKDGEKDKNDPIQFLTWSGLNRVKTALRKAIQKGVFYDCTECGHSAQLRSLFINFIRFRCHVCGSTDIRTYQREISMATIKYTRSNRPLKEYVRHLHEKEKIQRFRESLSPRELQVFDLIMADLDSKNYMKKIGEILGISAQCVNQYLKRIRIKYKEFV